MPFSPRAVLFDMDGVLVRTEEIWFRLVEEAGRRFRGQAITREEFTPTFGQGTAADVHHFGLRCAVAELDTFYVEAFSQYLFETWVNPHAQPLLEKLQRRGFPLAIVTNTVSPLAEQILRESKLRPYFDYVACADFVPQAKPAPDLVLHACEKLKVSPAQACMIGDSKFDRAAARAAGVHFFGLMQEGDVRIEELPELLHHVTSG